MLRSVSMDSPMSASRILDALRAHHRGAALVPEVVIHDDYPVWADQGPSDGTLQYSRRIDALMFETLQRTAIEIKVSVADAKRDTYRKVQPWRRVVHRFVYAVPAGLLEHPPVYGCGLWWVHPDGRVEVRRKVTINHSPEPLPQHVIQALAYRAARKIPPSEA